MAEECVSPSWPFALGAHSYSISVFLLSRAHEVLELEDSALRIAAIVDKGAWWVNAPFALPPSCPRGKGACWGRGRGFGQPQLCQGMHTEQQSSCLHVVWLALMTNWNCRFMARGFKALHASHLFSGLTFYWPPM